MSNEYSKMPIKKWYLSRDLSKENEQTRHVSWGKFLRQLAPTSQASTLMQ